MRFGLDVRLTYYTTGGIARYMRHLAQLIPTMSPDAEHVHIFRRGHRMTYADGVQRVDSWIPAHHRFETSLLGFELAPHGLDVLHSPDFITPKFGAKHRVSTVHDLTFLLHPEFLTEDSRRYYGGNIGPSVARADAVIAVSNATKADLVNLLDVPAEKVHVRQFQRLPDLQVRADDAPRDAAAVLGGGIRHHRRGLHQPVTELEVLSGCPPIGGEVKQHLA